jgi:beta-N-acetylhexosaminidase
MVTFFSLFSALSQTYKLPPFFETDWAWVDSVYNCLNEEERIAQLIMVPVWSDRGPEHEQELIRLIERYGIGGIAFFQGGPVRQAAMVNKFQEISKVPILMGIDAEWGLAMRLDSTTRFPFQMALGAIRNDSMLFTMGQEIGRQLKLTGVQVNFAPVLDVNNNPENPVINYRSFGSNKYNVSQKGIAYMLGMQDQGVLATGKHFPGHGDTDIDSHLALPVITHSRERMDEIELYPFRKAIRAGLGAIMVAHLHVPSLDPDKALPTTLSERVIDGLLDTSIGFKGLIMTDALNMKGVTNNFPPGEIEIRAMKAGNDLLVYVEDVGLAIDSIRQAIKDGRILRRDLENSCKSVLAVKRWTGLHDWTPLRTDSLVEMINTPGAELINRELTAASLTVLRNRDQVLPLSDLEAKKIASVSIGRGSKTVFQRRLDSYSRIDSYYLSKNAGEKAFEDLLAELNEYDMVLLGLHNLDMRPQMNFGITEQLVSFAGNLMAQNSTILSLFGNPYALGKLKGLNNADGIVLAYQENDNSQDLTAQLLFGGIGASGRLPVDIGTQFRAGEGVDIDGGIRFAYTLPEAVGMDGAFVKKKIDSICQSGLDQKAYPGCEVLVARHGKIVFHECYGFYSYDLQKEVSKNAIFDLASVTKVSGPLPGIMHMVELGSMDLDAPFSRYWTDFIRTDKAWLTLREALAHQGSLKAWIPYYEDTKRKNGSFRWNTFKPEPSMRYPIRVSDSLWIHRHYIDKIYKAIKNAPLRDKREYLYSGLPSYLYPAILEKLTGRCYEEYLYNEFYRPLGAWTLVYNPLRFYDIDRIIPTEHDDFFRNEKLRGYVHDEGAAMMGGISGNAGLFATAEDLAKLHQMYLWKGQYGGRRFLKKETIEEFIRYQFPDEGSRRGLGFDKPLLDNAELDPSDAYPAYSVSPSSFGHSGYTGTMVWADPDTGLLYVFLSNRVYPTRNNSTLYDLNIRSNILETLYEGID